MLRSLVWPGHHQPWSSHTYRHIVSISNDNEIHLIPDFWIIGLKMLMISVVWNQRHYISIYQQLVHKGTKYYIWDVHIFIERIYLYWILCHTISESFNSLPHGGHCYHLKLLMVRYHKTSLMMRQHWCSIGSWCGLVPSGCKPPPEPMPNQIYIAL